MAISIEGVVRVFMIFLSGCDICPARLFFRTGKNVFLPPKAEIRLRTHHDSPKYLFDQNWVSKPATIQVPYFTFRTQRRSVAPKSACPAISPYVHVVHRKW